MKFYCDRCNNKYSIADEKVRGKIVKVRCKRCSEIITVRGDQLDQQSAGGVGEAAAQSQPEWYYSIDGETFGPVAQRKLEQQYASGEITDSSYVWTDSFGDWKPAAQVEPFRSAIQEAKRAAARNRKQTLGVEGAVESIQKAPEEDEAQGRGQRSANRSRQDGQGQKKKQDGEGGRSSRLEKLRSKLKSNFASTGSREAPSDEDLRETDEHKASQERDEQKRDEQQEQQEQELAPTAESPAPEEALEADDDSTREFDALAALGKDSDLLEPEPGQEQADEFPEEQAEAAGAEESAAEPSEAEDAADEQQADEQQAEQQQAEQQDEDQKAEDEAAVAATVESPSPTPEADEPAEPSDADDAKEDSEDGDDFALPPSGSERLEAGGGFEIGDGPSMDQAEGSGQEGDGLFAGVDHDASDEPGADEQDAHHEEAELPTAPSLGGDDPGRSFGEEVSKSLLIQLDKIQKEGRGAAIGKTVLAVVLTIAMAGVWYYQWRQRKPDEPVVQEQQPYAEHDDELVIRRYSEEEQNKIRDLAPRRIKSPEDLAKEQKAAAKVEEKQPDKAPAEAKPDDEPTKLAQNDKTGGGMDGFPTRGSIFGEDGKEDGSFDQALDDSKKKSVEGNEKGSKLDESQAVATAEEAETKDPGLGAGFEGIGGIDTTNSPKFERPEDNIGKSDNSATKIPSELSKEQINEGIGDVQNSVGSCRQRHARRGAPLEVRKIYMTVEVKPSGRVASYDIEPSSLDGTAFERCMSSHRRRWSFGRFNGDTQKLRVPFILE